MADSIKLSGTYDSIEAYNILTEMQTLETTIEGYKTDAETAATNAGTSETNAGNSASAAATSESNASTYAGNALGYANAASASANDASGYATAANGYATTASEWATKISGPVSDSDYSAKYYANAASSSASAAAASEAVVAGALPTTGGTMTGNITMPSGGSIIFGNKSLTGNSSGNLQFDSKETERVQASGTGYIRYVSGLQICWDSTSTISTATTVTLTLPVAFVNNGYKVAIGRWWAAAASEDYYVHDATITNFKLTTIGTVGGGNHSYMYIAIGKWK